jgi:hypothetical protein
MALQQSANEKLRLFNAFSKDEFVQIVEHIVVKWINEQPMNLVEKLSGILTYPFHFSISF